MQARAQPGSGKPKFCVNQVRDGAGRELRRKQSTPEPSTIAQKPKTLPSNSPRCSTWRVGTNAHTVASEVTQIPVMPDAASVLRLKYKSRSRRRKTSARSDEYMYRY